MANFDEEFKKVIVVEGGYVDDPDDSGGETYLGISRRYNPDSKMWNIIDDIKKSNEIFIEKYQELINYFLNLLQKIKQIKQEKEKLLLHFIPNNFNIDNIKKEVDELVKVFTTVKSKMKS